MKSYQQHNGNDQKSILHGDAAEYSFQNREEQKLREAIYMSDMEKFRLFTKMLKTNTLYRKAVITHKKL